MELRYITVGFGSFIGCFHVRPPLLLRNILIIGVRTFINPGWNQEIVLQCTNCSAASQARNQSRLTATKKNSLNMFAPTWTLLHTFNRHDHHDHHDDHDHDHDHHHHHIMIIISLKFATPSEQYVDWGNSINFIFIGVQNLPPPLNNMLIGVYNNINFIFMRDQNLPPALDNMLIGVITSTLSSYPPEVRRGATSGLQRTCLN